MQNRKIAVDLVYTWVNGEDEDYLKTCFEYSGGTRDTNPERYRDTYQLLKYSLRSVVKHIDWFNKIYIVTARPQVPEWIDASHPKIRVVHHDEIIDEEYLPTFNPNCIESFLHKIPGLQKHFLYINDDFLFGSKTEIHDFFPNGKIRIFNTLFGENLPWRIYDGKNDIIGLGIIEHTPLFINKDYWEAMTKLFPDKMDQTRSNKFRKDEDLMTYKFFRYFMLKYKRQESQPIYIRDLLKINTFHKIMNHLPSQRKAFLRLERKKPKFYCLNDDQRDNPNPEVVKLVKGFLDRMYPERSEFEGF
tara:strand:+ start:205 stop:1113 length:909 start_codon:yes stop_codon:yes gene_type:complete